MGSGIGAAPFTDPSLVDGVVDANSGVRGAGDTDRRVGLMVMAAEGGEYLQRLRARLVMESDDLSEPAAAMHTHARAGPRAR